MQRVIIALFVFGLGACAQSEASTTPPANEAEAGAEAPEVAPEAAAEPVCTRNSSEVCECADGASGLRVCLEGTWADCACEEDSFANDDLAFDDE